MDLIRTLEDDAEVEYESTDDSDAEVEAPQPKKKRQTKGQKANDDFDDGFQFADSQEEYVRDTWNDLARYIKKKARTTLDEKISKVRKEIKQEDEEEDDNEDEGDISEDDLVHDAVRVKEGDAAKKQRKRERESKKKKLNEPKGEDVKVVFEDADLSQTTDSFYNMNLSR